MMFEMLAGDALPRDSLDLLLARHLSAPTPRCR
jgi:hypothetical protein